MRKVWVPAILLVTGCSRAVSIGSEKGPAATATINDANGVSVGVATFVQTANGLVIDVNSTNIPAGVHAVHLHPIGNCKPANNYAAAGTHLNPANKEHGLENPKGPHAGDLPNIDVASTKVGRMHTVNKLVTLDELFDADGSSILIHANKDDNVSQPAGGSGAKIACGVITRK